MAARISRSVVVSAVIVAFVVGGFLLLRGSGSSRESSTSRARAAADAEPAAEPSLSAPPVLGVPSRGADGAGGSIVPEPARPTRERRIAVHVDTGHPASPSGTLVWFQGHPETEAAPDAAGRLEILLPDGASLLVGRLADGHWARTTVPSDAVRAELVFSSAVSLAGTVRGPDGTVWPALPIRINGIGARDPTRRDPLLRDYDRRAEVVETRTSLVGGFEVRGLESAHVEVEIADPGIRLLVADGVVSAKLPAPGLELIADRVRIVEAQCVDSKTRFPVTCHTVAVTNWPTGYASSLFPAFPPRQLWSFPWPAAATGVDAPVVELLASGYLPRTVRLDASVSVESGVLTIPLDRDPLAPAVGAIRIAAPEEFDPGRLGSIDLMERDAEDHVRYSHPVTVRGQRYLVGIPVGEWKIRLLGRMLDSTIVVRAGETTELRAPGPALPSVVLRPRLGAHAIGGRLLCLLTPDASTRRADGSAKDVGVTQVFIDVGPDGTASLGVLAPGAYSILLARDTDSGKATFTVPDAGPASDPVFVDVPMVAHPSFGDGSR